MAIVKWTPMDIFDDMDRFFSDDVRGLRMSHLMTPAVDVYEDKDHVIVEAPLAGVDPAKVNIEIEDSVLKISGSSEQKSEVDEKNYYRKEIRIGAFYRAVALPKAVVGEKAEATFKDGILKISVPKADEAKPRRITVKTS